MRVLVCGGHKEVAVKVNAFVDEGIAPLVSALSEIEGLVTLESCQGDPAERDAYVIFAMPTWRCIGIFLFDLLLPALSPDLRAVVSLQIQAYDDDVARGSITIDPQAVKALSEIVQSLARSAVSQSRGRRAPARQTATEQNQPERAISAPKITKRI